jgi:hypothetical protein
MKLVDIVSFRKDLLFNGAVQLSWFEKDRLQAEKAAEHFVFHGPDYHGVSEADIESSSHQLVDTASFTLEILERITGKVVDEPFSLAIAGYGTGKSHLAITLATLLSNPKHEVASKILVILLWLMLLLAGVPRKLLQKHRIGLFLLLPLMACRILIYVVRLYDKCSLF